MKKETETKISINGKEVEYIDLINKGHYRLCNRIDNLIDDLRSLPDDEKAQGIIWGDIRVWEE